LLPKLSMPLWQLPHGLLLFGISAGDKREKCDEERGGCGRVHGLVEDHEKTVLKNGDWSQLSLVGSMGVRKSESSRDPRKR